MTGLPTLVGYPTDSTGKILLDADPSSVHSGNAADGASLSTAGVRVAGLTQSAGLPLVGNSFGVQTTSELDPQVAASFTLPAEGVATFQTFVFGRTEAGEPLSVYILASVESTAGVVSLLGATATPVNFIPNDLIGIDVSLIVNGLDLEVQVTGIAATVINWRGHVTYYLF